MTPILHRVIESETFLLPFLLAHGVSEKEAIELMDWGAVYVNKKRIAGNVTLKKDDYLRVHLKPKRFPRHGKLGDRLLFENGEILVVNKPPGVPVHETLDNRRENLLVWVQGELKQKLWVVHRIDTPAQGIVIFAKSAKWVSRFHQLIALKKVTREYEAWVEWEPPVGRLTHYMEPSGRAPKKISSEPQSTWQECRLDILSAQRGDTFFRLEIRLDTGRTHQIRAQLSKIGNPIVGDGLYGSPWRFGASDTIALRARRLKIDHPETPLDLFLPSWLNPGDPIKSE